MDDLERDGPSNEKLDRFEGYLAKGTAKEINDLCQSAASDIARRMEFNL